MSRRWDVPRGASLAQVFGAAAIAAIAGCATPQKPPELEALERLRADTATVAAAKRSPDLVTGADRWLEKAREKWQSNDLDEATHAALMGQIRLKNAIALYEQDRARARIASADDELARATEEQKRLQKELAALRESTELLRRLQEATAAQQKMALEKESEQKTLAEQLAAQKQKAASQEKIAEAELALKTAETVNARKYAAPQYSAAADMLVRAQQEFAQGNFQGAQLSADLAKGKANESAALAKPLYQQEAESAQNRVQAEALARDAATVGVEAKRDMRGSLQRLVLPLPGDMLFDLRRKETTIGGGRGGPVLDAVAALIKKYPTYPVQVIGYTDSRGRPGELLAISLARAQAVYSALVLRGVDAKRLVVSGQGPSEPISDNRTGPGRARNNRVEVIFLYQ